MPETTIPRPGLGTWLNVVGNQCRDSVAAALDVGYRHIDTAQGYDNEDQVGEGLALSDVPREDIFLATKVSTQHLDDPYDDIHRSARESLEKLGVDSIDLLYVHWPAGAYEPEQTLRAFNELYDEGVMEYIGVSNFTPDLLDEAQELLDGPILANQVEMHPYQHQDEMVEYTREHDMYLVAYSPLARGEVFDIPEIQEIAAKHDISPPQVSLAWLMSKEHVIPIPMADVRAHIEENFRAREIELDPEDIERIESIETEKKYVDPDYAPWR